MADSVAEIHRKEAADKVIEKLERNKMNAEEAAVRKLEDKGREVKKLTMAEIESSYFQSVILPWTFRS